MKNWKSILVTVFSFFAIASMVLFNSCVKDPCSDLACKNGGSCSDGYCQCPTGFEGAECEIKTASRFIGKWAGSTRCNNFPIISDTVDVSLVSEPDQVLLKLGAGNTALLGYKGTAETPETRFYTYNDDDVEINAYMRVDGGLLQLYMQTLNKKVSTRQNCYFSGLRISQ
ncbi:calcium-binding EGF-like domain-containing protein [Taibaiella koreensis]|uniref:calcium-binding EGF-like domain-containing protein n=1 Tax=Taibaiella koreensis TaxID=1268548 RepID=UPI000E59C4C8|nr:calcium-binding EGF-like domain-containing protein [Taibaiella koreensis]